MKEHLLPTSLSYKFELQASATSFSYKLQLQAGDVNRTLLGEMMYAYVTCRPDIGYAITTMSKYLTKPSARHYEHLRGIGKYLRLTKDWGIKFKRTTENPTLDETKFKTNVVLPPNLPEFTVDVHQPKLIVFVDASYANDPRKRRSTTSFVFTYCGGAIIYRSKIQSITALSSTEAEFLAAVLCAKIALYLRFILYELGLVILNLLRSMKIMPLPS